MQNTAFSALRVLGISGGNRTLTALVLALGVAPIGFNVVSDALKFCVAFKFY